VYYRKLEDTALLQLLRKDDEQSFREIYARFHDFLYIYAFRLTGGDEYESQYILQTLFHDLWNK